MSNDDKHLDILRKFFPAEPSDITDEFCLALLDTSRRISIIWEALGIDEIDRRFSAVLLENYPEGVSTTVLTHEAQVPRPTLLRRLRWFERASLVEPRTRRNQTFYRPSDHGRRLSIDMTKEVYMIARGWQRGFSPSLLERAVACGFNVKREAKTLLYPRLVP